jgi:hypothetical protein
MKIKMLFVFSFLSFIVLWHGIFQFEISTLSNQYQIVSTKKNKLKTQQIVVDEGSLPNHPNDSRVRQFADFLTNSQKKLVSIEKISQMDGEDFHHPGSVLLESAENLTYIYKTVLENREQRVFADMAMEYLEICASDQALVPSVRAVCLSQRKTIAMIVGEEYSIVDSGMDEKIIQLALDSII